MADTDRTLEELEELTRLAPAVHLTESDYRRNGEAITLAVAEQAIYEDVLRLRRNLARMDEAQKKRYKEQLAKVWKRACTIAKALFWEWVRMDEPILKGDTDGMKAVVQHRKQLAADDVETFRYAESLLFLTGKWDIYFDALYALYVRCRYEAYAPYWVAHCHWEPQSKTWINPRESTYRWIPKSRVWLFEDNTSTSWCSDLPPLLSFAQAAFEKELDSIYQGADTTQAFVDEHTKRMTAAVAAD